MLAPVSSDLLLVLTLQRQLAAKAASNGRKRAVEGEAANTTTGSTAGRKMTVFSGSQFPLCLLTLCLLPSNTIDSSCPPPPPSLVGSEKQGRRFPPHNKVILSSFSSFSPLGRHQGRPRSLKASESHPAEVFRLQGRLHWA